MNIWFLNSGFINFFVICMLLLTATSTAAELNISGINQSLQNVVSANAPNLTVVGEVRTVDGVANPRLWGKGRPNTRRYGASGIESGLCIAGSIDYGLSYNIVDWGSAADACPAGTWVCSIDDLKSGGTPFSNCDTARPDTIADGLTCAGASLDSVGTNHTGWLADTQANLPHSGPALTEAFDVNTVLETLACTSLPVWCCSESIL